jgi:hypothetical protein
MEDEFIPLIRSYFRERDRTTPVSQDKQGGSNEPQFFSESNKEDTLFKYFGSKSGSGSKLQPGEASISVPQANDSISVPYRSSVMDEERAQLKFMQNFSQTHYIEKGDSRKGASSSNGFFQKSITNNRETNPASPSIRAPPSTRTFADIIDIEEMIPASSNSQMKPETIDVERPMSLSKHPPVPQQEIERKIARATRDSNQNRVFPKKDVPNQNEAKPDFKGPVRRVASKSKPNNTVSQNQPLNNWINESKDSQSQKQTKNKASLTQNMAEIINDGAKSMPLATSSVKITRRISATNEDDNNKTGNEEIESKSKPESKGSSKGKNTIAERGSSSVNQETGKIVIGNDLRVEADSKIKGGATKGRGASKGKVAVTQAAISTFMNKLN